ncbi:MAG: TrmH family RNA methyltransferase [Mangrovibacterium sp.]
MDNKHGENLSHDRVNELIHHLASFVTPERLALFDRVLEQRTRYLTLVLEDIYQSQNASAVIRTADCFGIQDLHVIENSNAFQVDREVALGASKWINISTYRGEGDNTCRAIQELRDRGYRIVATSPHERDVSLEDFDLNKGKTAMVFGTELTGISDRVREEADEFLKIPMVGFTESFNISASAAIILHHLSWQMRSGKVTGWQLETEERRQIKLQWLRISIKSSAQIEEHFLKRQGRDC